MASMAEEKHPKLREDIREHCREIIDNPLRANFISVKEAYRKLGDKYPEETKASISQTTGALLKEADFTRDWSGHTYEIIPEEL